MKIAFLTGSLEAGHDGVGDYTRTLADACTSLGHATFCASIADRFLKESLCNKGMVRYPNALHNNDELKSLIQKLDSLNPDWISLQYVPYSFHPRGFVSALTKVISKLAPRAKLHIMFHETWIGPHKEASIPEKVQGLYQRHLLKKMLRQRPPNAVHTHASPYVHLLGGLGLQAEQLPLFSSIAITNGGGRPWALEKLKAFGAKIKNPETCWLIGVFGSLYPEWHAEPLIQYLSQACEEGERECLIISFGNIGAGEPAWRALEEQAQNPISSVQLGYLNSTEVSNLLEALDFGIAAPPWALIEKGSSVATMLDHGLPVIVNRDDVHFNFQHKEPSHSLLIKMDNTLPQKMLHAKKKLPCNSVNIVAEKFLRDLRAH